ncbi:uncharacterized protein RCC_12292 [Ramularia collo-cygni]|uniref:JmjC domain-containing protein n=1 Tax=Ramularia collo-cygni TaxID=112498 RepID=A0A2D3URL1_9PEZI|nr:uncharacterized protein RCC_12292 [Ramularia collo-cygni]CZT15090.1 uncharacterized protein RCC_12292 [Ramularia collo-cygni]
MSEPPVARMGNILRGVELSLRECDTTRSFLRHCQAFRDRILEDEQLSIAYATWLDLTLKRRGLKPSDPDDRWKYLRDLAARPVGSGEVARRTRALATLGGYISWEKTEHYNFHLAPRPMLELAVALTRSTSFDWAAFAGRINCAMLMTHIRAIEDAAGRQITIVDGRSFRNADIKVALKTAATSDLLKLVSQWAGCADGHMWLDDGECLARRPYVQMYLLQYDAFGILVPRTNVQQIQPCDQCHHLGTPPDAAKVTSSAQRCPPTKAQSDNGRRPTTAGKVPKLTVLRTPITKCQMSRVPSASWQMSKSQHSFGEVENSSNTSDDEHTTMATPCGEGCMHDFDTDMLDPSESSQVDWSSCFHANMSEESAAPLDFPPPQLVVSPSRLNKPFVPESHNFTLPRPPTEPVFDEAYTLALEQCMTHKLGSSLSRWTDELRSATVYHDPAGPANPNTAQHTADIWCMDEQAFCRFAQDKSFDRPILIKENFKDAVDFSLDRCVREICDRLAGSELNVQSPSSESEERISCDAFVRALLQTEGAYSAPRLPPWADANKPRLTSLPRYRLLKMLVERLEAQRGPDDSDMSLLRETTAEHDTISARGAYSGARIDALTGGWIRNLLGKSLWLFVPRKAMTSDDWDCFSKAGHGWDPQGKARAVFLHTGDVLFIPPGLHIVYSVLTLESSWMERGLVWDEWSIARLLESLHWLGDVRGAKTESCASFLQEVIAALEEVVTMDPQRFARGADINGFQSQFKVVVEEVAAFFSADYS